MISEISSIGYSCNIYGVDPQCLKDFVQPFRLIKWLTVIVIRFAFPLTADVVNCNDIEGLGQLFHVIDPHHGCVISRPMQEQQGRILR